MAIVACWCVKFRVTTSITARFVFTGRQNVARIAAIRTNAKLVIACGLKLVTLFLMLTRALLNKTFVTLSAYTAL